MSAGISAARDTGIKYATGGNIMFIDHDDYWKEITGIEMIVNQSMSLMKKHPF